MNERKLTKSELKKREDIIMKMKDNKRGLVKKYGKDAEAVMYGRATNMAKKQTKEMRDPKLTELIKDALKNPEKADLNKDGKLSDYEEKRGAAIEKNIKELDSSIPLEKDFTYDYEDIGQFYLEGFNRPHSLSNNELENLGKQVVDRLYGGDIGKAYDDLVNPNKNPYDINEAELPTSIIQKLSSEIKDAQGFAKAMLGIYDAIQDKEQKDYSKSQKFGKVLSLLKDIIDDKVEAEVTEDLDLGHEDNEPHMLKADLYRIGKYAMELYQMVDQFEGMGEVDFPSWWQSKVFKAKDALVGAKHYLDFEINEPKIDAVVDVATDVVDEDINQLGTDDDTGFQASLYTPNEMGAVAVGKEYASGAFEGVAKKLAKQIKETTPGDPERFVGSGGDEIDSDSNINVTTDNPAQDAEIGFGLEEESTAENMVADKDIAKEIKKLEAENPKGFAKEISRLKARQAAIDLMKKTKNEVLKEFTDNRFKGSEVIDDANERGPDMFGKGIFAELLPKGVASENDAVEALKAHDKSPIKARMGQYAPMFVHVQYHNLEHEGEEYQMHQTQYYNSNFKDRDPSFNPGVSKITLFKDPEGEDTNLGTIIVKTDEYVQDLRNLPGLGKRVSESFDSLAKKLDKQKGIDKDEAAKIAGKIANIKRKGGGKGPTAKQKKRMSETEKDKKSLSKPVAKDLKKMKSNFNDLKKRLKLEDKKKKVAETILKQLKK